jgi:hypothetical protein
MLPGGRIDESSSVENGRLEAVSGGLKDKGRRPGGGAEEERHDGRCQQDESERSSHSLAIDHIL